MRILGVLAAAMSLAAANAAAADSRVVLVTLDGLRWQEVFRGAETALAEDPTYVEDRKAVKAAYLDPTDRKAALMPFLHEVVAKQGVLIGDRDNGSCARVTNDQWFSYPGYNEILTGRPDPAIRSNDPTPNANVTVLEWLNRQPGFKGKVAAFTSWNVFPAIINAERSGVPVDAGMTTPKARTSFEAALGRMQTQTPRIWATVRFDVFTHNYALEALKRDKPRMVYISYGETDDFAHEGHYGLTLDAARRTDGFLRELWTALQADKAYGGKTTLIVTTDHGRGAGDKKGDWKSHGKVLWPRSDETWIAVIGPGVKAGLSKTPQCAGADQVAATALTALGLDWKAFDPTAGAPLPIFEDPR
ncbi:alkaline phosphatase family protein [Phenylobacterium sp.]|uniref:alkaline phosphatase family protein n=1 Tax=Phenylobacterium sp. TaxID=1871053 RepID=UPI0027354247|nr:alkaline phosphatase family protein [Phenylobacterium sp.]MDP3852864.1 alkaline phosphatase family protein [Phenylobacterium sp.]